MLCIAADPIESGNNVHKERIVRKREYSRVFSTGDGELNLCLNI